MLRYRRNKYAKIPKAGGSEIITSSFFLRLSESVRRRRVRLRHWTLIPACCLFFTVGCRQDMQDQPRMKPFRSTTFFRDGMSSRPPVTGTVPRGHLNADREFFTGKKNPAGTSASTGAPATTPPGANLVPGTAAYPDDVEEFP